MTEKRYLNIIPSGIQDTETGKIIHGSKIGDLLNEQEERIKELESENKMLKLTIGRNESYIKRLTTKGKWSNTGDVDD